VAKTAPEVPDAGAVWSEQDTTPSAIEEALRSLLQQQFARDNAHAPARVLNLVVVVDRDWRGEVMNRLEQVGRYHASRTILCTVERGRTTLDASVMVTVEARHARTSRTSRGSAWSWSWGRSTSRSSTRSSIRWW
jgi:hypothetical protein